MQHPATTGATSAQAENAARHVQETVPNLTRCQLPSMPTAQRGSCAGVWLKSLGPIHDARPPLTFPLKTNISVLGSVLGRRSCDRHCPK